jgi:hypothetical protein
MRELLWSSLVDEVIQMQPRADEQQSMIWDNDCIERVSSLIEQRIVDCSFENVLTCNGFVHLSSLHLFRPKKQAIRSSKCVESDIAWFFQFEQYFWHTQSISWFQYGFTMWKYPADLCVKWQRFKIHDRCFLLVVPIEWYRIHLAEKRFVNR